MQKQTLLVLFLFLLSAQIIAQSIDKNSTDWYQNFQHSNTLNLKALGDISEIQGSKHLERYRWKETNALYENGTVIPQNKRIRDYLASLSQQKSTSQVNANWTPIGLTSWTCGNTGYNPGNGRINAITVDPNDSQTIYVCAASGGLWKSNDGGNTWNTNTDAFPVLGTSDIAVDPNNSNNLYLATGDRDGLDTYGVGIYKSIDGGSTWSPSGLFNNFADQSFIINALEIDPQRSNVIYAGSNGGLYKSTDFGNTWNKVINSTEIMEVKVNPLDTNTVFAVSKTSFYRSRNGGNSFQTISNGISSSPIRIAMDITPADTSRVYLFYAESIANNSKIYISNNGGNNFSESFNFSTKNLLGYEADGSDNSSQAYYDLAIAVSKTNANNIYLGGINVWHSTDGGNSWNISTKWEYNSEGKYAHADIHCLDFYGNTLFCGSDGGIAKNVNNSSWQNLSSGLNISQIYNFSSSTDGHKISIACQDNGINVSSNGKWTHVMGADGTTTKVNPIDSSIVFLAVQSCALFRSDSGGDNAVSIFNPSDYYLFAPFITPISLCKSEPNTLDIGLGNVYRTTNNGDSWTKISTFSDGSNCNVISTAPSSPNYIYLAKMSSFHYTHDGGNTWQEASGLGTGIITDIAISNTDSMNIYVLKSSTDSKIYHSTDGGQSFTQLPKVLSNISSKKIALENKGSNGIYIATDLGIKYTNDNLSNWVSYSDQLPFVKVTDIEIVNNKIRVATFGRGVWESDLYLTTSIKTSDNINNYITVFPNPTTNRFTISLKDNKLTINEIEIFNISGSHIKSYSHAQQNYSIKNLVNGIYFVNIKTNKGNIVKRIIKK